MAMLHLFLQQQKKIPFTLAVAHFDHQSRQGASTKEGAFVRDFCERENIPFHQGTAPVHHLAQVEKQGFEAMARQLRYDFLEKTAETFQYDYIATAHQAEDNLETFLLNLCRGTGLQGLSAIPPQRGKLRRPLLKVTRQEIATYLAQQQIPFFEDESNKTEKYRRNFIRHQVLPKLQQINPKLIEHSMNTISIIREENNYLSQLVQDKLPLIREENSVACDRETLHTLPPALQGRAYQYLVEQMSSHYRLSPQQREQAKNLPPCGEIFLCDPLRLRRSYDKIICERIQQNPCPPCIVPENQPFTWGNWQITAEKAIFDPETAQSTDSLLFSYTSPLFLRTRQQGDLLHRPNRPEKTLKKLCIQEKIPRQQRDFLPVFHNAQQEILGVWQLGVDLAFLPQKGQEILRISIIKATING